MEERFQQTLEYLTGLQGLGWKLGLERMNVLLERLGNPHKKSRFIHIAGTNGKSSVAAMFEAVFRQAGYKTGLFTSPHLVDIRELVRLNGEMISKEQMNTLVQEMRPHIELTGATFFEAITALSFLFFSRQNVDIVILETGVGGRDDATNVVTPDLSVITSIDLEHTRLLGDSITDIAGIKAGIIKTNVPCVTGELIKEAFDIVKEQCEINDSPLFKAKDIISIKNITVSESGTDFAIEFMKHGYKSHIPLFGEHFAINAGIVAASVEILNKPQYKITQTDVMNGLAKVNWPGRFQYLRKHPPVIVDVAHNTASIAALVNVINSIYPEYDKQFILGLLDDKDVKGICKILAGEADKIFIVSPESNRAMKNEMIKDNLLLYNIPLEELENIEIGLNIAMSGTDDKTMFCFTGSHYIAGSVLKKINSLTS